MKKLLKILSVALTAVLIVTTFSIGMSAYAATDDVVGNYKFEITSTYKDVDWANWKAYKAATHVHTTRSDADEEVDDMIENYYSLGFDALALTDHGTVNYGWTSGQSRIAIFAYQAFVHGGIDELSTARYNEITTGTGAVKGGSSPRGYGMTEIPKGIELNGMSTKKCHINGYFVDAGHGELGTTVTWPRSAVKTNYDAGGITHINHVGEWAEAKSDISVYDASFVQDFASVYEDYCPNRPNYSQSTIRGCIGMELVNTTDNRTRNDRYLYDETMKLLAPQGINIFVFCEDDAHETSDCDKNAQFFLMPSNDKQSKNIEYCMKHGQFYTCSKNSKNPYELGDGFNASGEYPVVSYVGVDDAKNQIIVTVKNANKSRLVADGNLIDTIDTSLGENTVVFDLNKYEDKINSYVRAYFTGPGGILYLQTFIVKKTVEERSSVQFITPSADTDVTVYNSNGSVVDPVNSEYVYYLDPGNYSYVASRPGYITTDEIPFTVTQEDYNNNVKKKINVSLEINSDLVYTYFYVPETIYLNGSDNKTFESYVDRKNSPDSELNRTASLTGNLYFSRPGATDIKISYDTVEGVSVNTLVADRLEAVGPTYSGSIISGSMSTSLDSGSYSMIEWTASYKCGGTDMTSKAYTYVYAPLRGANSTVAAGGYAETNKNIISWPHSTMSITATTWLVGVHSVSNGYTAYKFTPNGGSALTNASGVDNITVSGTGMITANDDSNGGSKTVTPAGAKGTLTVDTSRYDNLNQIPGLKFGLDINNASSDEDNAEQYFEVNGQRVFTKTNAPASSMNGQRIYMSSSSQSGYSVPLSSSVTSVSLTGSASCSKSNRTDRVTGSLSIELSYVNKNSLRDRYNSAIQFSYQPEWFDNQEDYTNYLNAIKAAEKVLGNPAANASEVESASNAISAFMSTVALAEGSATVNHVDSNGNILETETVPYTICDTIVVSSKEFDGYTYSGRWTETDSKNDVIDVGSDAYESLMTLKTNYTFNFIYDANEYRVTFVSPDESYLPDAPTGAYYNSDYTLPTLTPSKTGYDFIGWYFDLDENVYPAGGTVSWAYAQDGTFTAEWAAKTYVATFDVNGGKPGYAVTSVNVSYEDIFDVPEAIPEKVGYAFEGWDVYDSSNTLVGSHTAGGRFVWDYAGDLTFVAQWDVVTLNVSFDAKGGSTPESITVNYGAEYGTLPVPVKAGYNFDGWYLDENYTTPVDANTIVTLTEAHTLYAKWSKGSYTITYYVDGEVYTTDSYNYGEEVQALAPPVREGYAFSGWSEIPATMPANDVTVTGSFTILSFKITYKLDGGLYKEVEYEYGARVIPEAPVNVEGYRFTGWKNEPETMPADNVIVTGTLMPYEYSVTYYIDGTLYSTERYFCGSEVTMITVPDKNGYTFSGWDKTITVMPAQNVDVYGTYDPNEYSIKYYVDGELYGTQTYLYQETIVPLENPVKPGYEFSGWSVIPSKMPARDVTVNGSFTAKQIYYYFRVNNKLISAYTIRGTIGTPITPPVVEVPENYEFSGWSPVVPAFIGAESMTFNGSTVKVKSFVEFDLNGGSGTVPSKQAYAIGSSIQLTDNVARAGFSFGGWSEDPNAQSGFTSYTVTDSDVTLYAVWNTVPAVIEPADKSDTIVDSVYKLISGLKERITAAVFEDECIEVVGEGAQVTIEQGIGFGTGSKAVLTQGGNTVATYEIVIYGDVDGDGIADGRDVQLAQMLAEGLLTSDDVSPAVFEAADCDHNGSITQDDVQLIIESGILTETIDQTK